MSIIVSIITNILGVVKAVFNKVDAVICSKFAFFGGLNVPCKVLFGILVYTFIMEHSLLDLLILVDLVYVGHKKVTAKKANKEEPAPSQEKAK